MGGRSRWRWLAILVLLGALAVWFAPGGDGRGEEAHWELSEEPSPDDELLELSVVSSGCDGPASGDVEETDDEVRIRITVDPADDPCERGVVRSVTVRLADRLGERVIVAVGCPPGGGGSTQPARGCPAPGR